MNPRIRIGILTPSSNTALEPLTTAIVAGLPDVSVHFARFTVTEIALTDAALDQFDAARMLVAARQLTDARVDVIGWSGTSAGWLGFEHDAALCRVIEQATGIPATSSVLALNELLERTGVRRLGLVTPYLDDVQQRIVRQYAQLGIECVSEQHLGLRDNFSFAEVPDTQIAALMRQAARARPDAVATFCTNLHAAHLAGPFEQATGIAAYDTVATVVWKTLRMAGVDTRVLARWGKLFEMR
ncbi:MULTISPECIES: aspartate/glutamate racemase family protein [Burkholderia]|uniref:maleate cis-trans isomerase family protein n=1 Tax=Burkholderia TaxID=32008 RepID=UPI000B79F1C4|nr:MULTISPECIES: aspartate/glutamate racemase family protein [Burkholderia]MBY4726101.1 aspartate/glutamate racemase family protein [Burkholderia contaminans]MCI3968804.1 aspartate/glutamate racemase family protein [Burkholderia sp. HI4860]MDN7788859.1 aspartate/glutamate racemase family protein [Burkholderia contaminans]OXI99471.1 Asp/Glu/hydantoin racemase [Burkholderia sp. AU33647]